MDEAILAEISTWSEGGFPCKHLPCAEQRSMVGWDPCQEVQLQDG